MIVIISDLHFEEEASDAIAGQDGQPGLMFRRNLDAKSYRSFFLRMAEEVERRRIREFNLIFAGDLFDFSRTVKWFEDDIRPYVPLNEVSAQLEEKILSLTDAIAAEPPVAESLRYINLLARGRYLDDSGAERDFPAERISIQYLSGNHDRLANATARIRRRLRELLGLDGDAPFAHIATFPDPAVLIRHGQEYDRNNFCEDLGEHFGVRQSIPLEIPEEFYSGPSFGDFITIDVATRLPYLLRRQYGDAEILRDRVLAALYLRLLQFDDVRPQSALLDYLLDTSGGQFSAEDAWERLVPIFQKLLAEIHDNRFFRYWLARRAKPWAPAELEAARGLLKIGPWRNRVSREVARKLGHFFLGGDEDHPELFAMREQVIATGEMKLVISGHTHVPAVELIASDEKADRFYINTGTWRNRIPSTPDRRTFGMIKTLTYVMLFSSDEDPAGEFGTFDYWSGYTRHWNEGAR